MYQLKDLPELDAEHRELYRLTGELRQAVSGASAAVHAQPLCRELAQHVTAHFSHEERLMRSVAYPHQDWHARQHAAAQSKVSRLRRCVLRGDAAGARGQIDALAGWLTDHIGLSDRMLGAYIRNYRRTHAR